MKLIEEREDTLVLYNDYTVFIINKAAVKEAVLFGDEVVLGNYLDTRDLSSGRVLNHSIFGQIILSYLVTRPF